MSNILVLHGPNLNLLGTREPHIYGLESLNSLQHKLNQQALTLGVFITTYQSNSESALIEQIQQAHTKNIRFIIINAAAFSHTSIAIRDALCAAQLPFVEVHLSNIYAREPFRQHSYLADIAVGTINGLGTKSYELALQFAHHYLTNQTQPEGEKHLYGYANN